MASSLDAEQRKKAICFLGSLEDKDAAWNVLKKLSLDEDNDVRLYTVLKMEKVFQYVTHKETAWNDLKRMVGDEYVAVQIMASLAISNIFPYVTDKEVAWTDLHRLAADKDSLVRKMTALVLGLVFQYLVDKDAASKDLHWLVMDEDRYVRAYAGYSVGRAFQYLTDKEAASKDLHRLAMDEDRFVLGEAGTALGMAFHFLADKEAALKDLHGLILDQDSNVRCSSYYSLGRISILKATEKDDEFRVHLEDAIEFFRKSSEVAKQFNPAAFCLPFYRSLHSLLFTEVPRQDEVQRYLAEAKEAIEASESKEVLLEAVNNLSKALQEVRAYSVDDILLRRRDLKSYTKYCLQTAECLREARSKAPLASKVVDYTLVEKSIPILNQKIKTLFKDVEATAGELCKSTKGTDLEDLGRDAYESTRGLNKVESWIVADRYLEDIVPLLKGHCNRLPKEAQAYLKTLVDTQDTASLEQRFDTLKSVLLASLVQGENDDRLVKELKELLDLHLQNIEFGILNLNTSSGNARKDLYSLKNQIDELQKVIESQGLAKKELAEALDEKDQAMIDRLEKMREKMLKTVRETTQLNASKRDVETILKELEGQDKLKKRDVLGIIADLSSLAGMALSIPPGAPRAAMNLAARLLE